MSTFTEVQVKEMRARKKAIKKRKRWLASWYKKSDEAEKRSIDAEWLRLLREMDDIQYNLVTHRNEVVALVWRFYVTVAPFVLALMLVGLFGTAALYVLFPE